MDGGEELRRIASETMTLHGSETSKAASRKLCKDNTMISVQRSSSAVHKVTRTCSSAPKVVCLLLSLKRDGLVKFARLDHHVAFSA